MRLIKYRIVEEKKTELIIDVFVSYPNDEEYVGEVTNYIVEAYLSFLPIISMRDTEHDTLKEAKRRKKLLEIKNKVKRRVIPEHELVLDELEGD